MIYLYKTNGVITVGEDGKVPVTYYGRGGKSGKFYPIKNQIGNDEVVIGNQIWASKNLDVTTYNNGDIIPEITDATIWSGLTTGAWCYYNNNSANGKIYGKLYNWYAVNDIRGLAPSGYRIPSDSDWSILSNYLGGNLIAGGKMKEIGFNHWLTPNTGATNNSGFTALGTGYRNFNGGYFLFNIRAPFWSSTEYDLGNATNRYLINTSEGITRVANDSKRRGAAIRLLRDLYSNFLINIGGDNYQVSWENLVIDGTSPTSFSDANTLLLNLFS